MLRILLWAFPLDRENPEQADKTLLYECAQTSLAVTEN